MKKLSLLFCLAFFCLGSSLKAQFRCQEWKQEKAAGSDPSLDYSARSDTFDILHFALALDFTALPSRYLKGKATISLKALQNHQGKLNLDLLQLQVDSVWQNGQAVSFSHNDTILSVDLLPGTPTQQQFDISVFYQGNPPGDGSGWGGWHQNNGYYFNLGVGFAANPHPYGRAWHPCFDNFVEKATYDFEILTRSPLKAYANGLLVSEVKLGGDSLRSNWQMTDSIPSYLASVAISNYAEVHDTFALMQRPVPVQLMARPADSLALIQSFDRLLPISQALEASFGPYRWQKIGYAATTTGAMEHATSIHMPVNLVRNGQGEDIIAHELAHHWWGNLVTCETDADMWINEGMAEYSSHLYTEAVDSRQQYLAMVRANQHFVLSEAHKRDDGYKAIYGLDHQYVYGAHVYQKGAMVGHNLRHYLGDSLFAVSLSQLLSQNAFGNLNSTEFRDQLSSLSGTSLTDFFNNQVFQPGFASYSIDSLYSSANSNGYEVSLTTVQRLHHAPSLHQNVALKLSFFGGNGEREDFTLMHHGSKTLHQISALSFDAEYATLNYEGGLLAADTYDRRNINTTGILSRDYGGIDLKVNSLTDTAEAIIIQHWAGPGGKTPQAADVRLSGRRFWTITGNFEGRAALAAQIPIRGASGEWEADLLASTGDSLVLLYRGEGWQEWMLWPHQQVNVFGPAGNMQGWVDADSLLPGDYVLANASNNIGLVERALPANFEVFPNPARDSVRVIFVEKKPGKRQLKIFTLGGQLIREMEISGHQKELNISLENPGQKLLLMVDGEIKILILNN